MKLFVMALSVLVLVVGVARSDDTTVDPAKLIGKWENTKVKGEILEFMKDGKLKVSTIGGLAKDKAGKTLQFSGTYKVAGDKLTTTISIEGKESTDTETIKTLTDKKLVLVNKKKKETEFARAK